MGSQNKQAIILAILWLYTGGGVIFLWWFINVTMNSGFTAVLVVFAAPVLGLIIGAALITVILSFVFALTGTIKLYRKRKKNDD